MPVQNTVANNSKTAQQHSSTAKVWICAGADVGIGVDVGADVGVRFAAVPAFAPFSFLCKILARVADTGRQHQAYRQLQIGAVCF